MRPDVPLKPYQKDFAYSYTLGVFPTIELLQQRPEWALKVIHDQHGSENRGVGLIRELCAAHDIRFERQDKAVRKLSSRGDTYAIGIFEKVYEPLAEEAHHIALVEPSDMGNLGTIMRTMLGFDVRDLAIVEPAADPFDPRVVRASMGALFQVSVSTFSEFAHYWTRYPQRDLYPFMTDAPTTLPTAHFGDPHTLIFGNESAGLPDAFHQIGEPVAIPQSTEVDSLNLAISVGIALYGAAVSA